LNKEPVSIGGEAVDAMKRISEDAKLTVVLGDIPGKTFTHNYKGNLLMRKERIN